MWLVFSIVGLLIRAIVGNLESESTWSDVALLENGANDIIDNQTGKSEMDASKEWNEESLATERNGKATGPSSIQTGDNSNAENDKEIIDYNRGNEPNVKMIISKRRETMGYWQAVPKNKEFLDSAQEKTDQRTYWREKNMISSHRLNSPTIHPLFRLPFDEGGGKRGKPFSRSDQIAAQTKRSRLVYGRNNRGTVVVDGYDVKRMPESNRLRWDRWGGKRARETIDRDRQRLTTLPKLDDGSIVLGVTAIGELSSKREEDTAKSSGRTNDEMRAIVDDQWDRKRNNLPYRIPFRVNNETSGYDCTTGEEIITNNDTSWFLQICRLKPEKRMKHRQSKKVPFNPWGGKRNTKTYALRFGDDYPEMPSHYAKQGQVYFPWGG